jgi:hypothetical protein
LVFPSTLSFSLMQQNTTLIVIIIYIINAKYFIYNINLIKFTSITIVQTRKKESLILKAEVMISFSPQKFKHKNFYFFSPPSFCSFFLLFFFVS